MALFGCVVHGGVRLTRGFTVPATVFTNNGAEVWMARGFSVSGTGFHSRTVELFFKKIVLVMLTMSIIDFRWR